MEESSVKPLSVLILGDVDCGDDLARWMDAHACVEHVESVDEAFEALGKDSYDVVIARARDFTAPNRGALPCAVSAILEGVDQGIGIVSETGELGWANPKMIALPQELRDRICAFCEETFSWAQSEVASGAKQIRFRRLTITTDSHHHYEITATPVIDLHNRITQVAVVAWDTSTARQLQSKIDAIDRAGRELLSLDADHFARLDMQERLSLLEQKVLRCTKEILHFENFEIRILQKKENQLDLVLASGMPASIMDVDLYASTEGNGICGYVAASGQSYICPDTAKDPRYRPAVENAKSSLTVPLVLRDEVIGVANFESTKLAAFNEHDRQFAEIFGRYIVLSLHVLELLNTERHTTTGRLGNNVMAEITAPLNDILTDVENLLEDYIGHDDLRHRLRVISENVVKIRETIKALTSAKPGFVGGRSATAAKEDPVLRGKRVLVADDEDVIRETVRDVLIGYGCEVSTATNGADAIELIHERPFDLVLSDIKMPIKSGYEVFAAAKDKNAKTPVILTTGFGYDPNHSIVRARREGLAAVLFKPFKVDQLLNEIRMALSSVDA